MTKERHVSRHYAGTMNTLMTLETHVREQVRIQGLDPLRQKNQLREVVDRLIHEYEAQTHLGKVPSLGDPKLVAKVLMDSVAGLGPLQQYMDDPRVEEIWINSPHQVFIAKDGQPELTNTILESEQVARLVELMLTSSGRRLDLSTPFVDAMLPGGERLHVVIPDVTSQHMCVNIRKFVAKAHNLSDMVAKGSLTASAAYFLEATVKAGLNVVVSGATGAGKTTFLRALAGSISPRERIITVEEVFELNLSHRDVVAMQCRQPNLEGNGAIDLRRLVKESLRMRPDRIIVGEVRESESLDLLIALNSGLPGMATVHANSARDAVLKLSTLPLLAGENVTAQFVNPTVASAIDIVVHLDRWSNGKRFVREISGLSGRVEDGNIEISTLYFRKDERLVRGPGYPPKMELFERHGYTLASLFEGGREWAR